MAILNNNPLIGSGGNQGYNINNSLRFRASASAYLNRTPASAGNRQTWTYSTWIKLGSLSLGTQQFLLNAGPASDNERTQFTVDSNLIIGFAQVNGGSVVQNLSTTQVFRDPSAWYHIVLAVDTTQATASNRVKIYINGSQVTAFSTATYMAQNTNTYINNTTPHFIGKYQNGSANPSDWYQTESILVDGQALTPSSFGETDTTTGVWKPKAYSGSYGTNGFYLKFSDIATTSGSNAGLGKDFSGNTNYWTTNNISVTSGTTYDAMTDSPTNTSATVANYAVMSPINTASGITVSNANLRLSNSTNGGIRSNASISVSSGKWYFEVTDTTAGTFSIVGIGQNNLTSTDVGTDALSYGWYLEYAQKVNNGSSSAYGTALTSGDVCMVAFDLDNNKLYFGKNGTWFDSGNPATGTNPAYTITAGTYNPVARPYGSSTAVMDMNFGQRPFSYTPPTGFNRLNTYNLPTPTILQGNKYMDATLWTGNGAGQTVVNAGQFKPDFLWIKSRSDTYANCLNDSVRGVTKYLFSNLTNAESTVTDAVTSFNTNGFTLNTNIAVNDNTKTYVGWQWQAGQGSTSSNTSGTITSTVSVNTTAGFSVVTYTGTGVAATIGHGLGVAPKFYIVKRRNASGDYWCCYHTSIGATKGIYLNTQDAAGTSDLWNNTEPTSTVFSVKTTSGVNASGGTYVAYCWAEIAGFSKFGSYDGNGQTGTGGPFIYTGFRPAFVLIKKYAGQTDDWFIFDNKRNVYNVTENWLQPNTSSAETSNVYNKIDMLSNGFGIRVSNAAFGMNVSGTSFIYMAFAENPFKNSLAR